jgi:hypothetical protein
MNYAAYSVSEQWRVHLIGIIRLVFFISFGACKTLFKVRELGKDACPQPITGI